MNNSEPTTRKRFYCNKNENEFELFSMDDTIEAISEVISKGATSISSLSFSWIPDKYHRAPVRYGNLYLIFEKGKSLRINRTQAIPMISFLRDYYDVDPLSLSFWISAKDGIHIEIPSVIYGGEEGDIYLPVVHKEFVDRLIEECSSVKEIISVLDYSAYSVGTGYMLDLENVRCSDNEKYKVPVSWDELLHMDEYDLLELNKHPRYITIEHHTPAKNSSLSELYEKSYSAAHIFPDVTNQMERLAGLENCTFLKYCMENIKILSEDEWSMMVGLLVRCGENGRELAREFSQGITFGGKTPDSDTLNNAIRRIACNNTICTCDRIKTIFDCGKECYVKTPLDLFQNTLTADAAEVANYLLKPDGLFYIENSGTEDATEVKISSPIVATHMTHDLDSCSWGKRVSFRDMEGITHNLTIKNSDLINERSNTVIERLVDNGLIVSPDRNSANRVKNYLRSVYPNKKAIEIDRCGWYKKCFILYTECIGDTSEYTYFPSFRLKDNLFQSAGSFEDWTDKIARPVSGQFLFEFTMCLGFAAVLLTPLGLDTFGVNLRGEGSTGKTTALMVAGSVCGGSGYSSGYLRQWRATDNALESIAAKHNDILLVLDELGQADGKSIGKSIYMIGNGETKSRLTQDAEERGIRRFKTVVLSSGEITVQDKIGEDKGATIKAGQAVRIIDIDTSAISDNGIFSFVPDDSKLADLGLEIAPDLPDKTKLSMFLVYLKQQSTKYYGTAIRKFLEGLINNYDENIIELQKIHQNYAKQMCPADATGQVIRVIRNFALVATAGEFAIEHGILPWSKGEVEKAVRFVLDHWLKQRNGANSLELTQAIERLKEVIQQDTLHFKTLYKREYPYKNEDIERSIREPIGYKKLLENGEWIYFIENNPLKNIYRGISKDRFMKELETRGWLVKNQNGKPLESIKVPDKNTAHGIAVYQEKISCAD